MSSVRRTGVYDKRNPFTVLISAGISNGGILYGFMSPISDASFRSACGWAQYDPAKIGEKITLWGATVPQPRRVRHKESGVSGFCADANLKTALAGGFELLNPSRQTRNTNYNRPAITAPGSAPSNGRRSVVVGVLVRPIKPDGTQGTGQITFSWKMPSFQWQAMNAQDLSDLGIQPINTALAAKSAIVGAEKPKPGRARKLIAQNGIVDKAIETFYGEGAPLNIWVPVSGIKQ